MSINDKIEQLSKANQKFFKRACVSHVISRVEKAVNDNPSDEALECVRLVRLWLSDEGAVSAEELYSAVDAAADAAWSARSAAGSATYAVWSAAYAVWSAARSADAAAWSAAWSAADAAVYAAWSAAYAAADADDDAYVAARKKEEQWQERLVDKLLRKQEIESSSDEGDLLTLARDFIEQNSG